MSAQKLLSGPEDNVGELKTLLALAGNQNTQISRLGMLSLLAVFLDIIPGYRIRPPTEQELAVKVRDATRGMSIDRSLPPTLTRARP